MELFFPNGRLSFSTPPQLQYATARRPEPASTTPTTVKELPALEPLFSFILLRPPPTTSAGGSTSSFSRTTEPVGYCVFLGSDDQPTSLPPHRPPQLGHASTMETQPLTFATQIASAVPQASHSSSCATRTTSVRHTRRGMKVRVRVVHVQPKKMMIVDLKQRGRLGALGVGMGCHGIGVENEFEVEVNDQERARKRLTDDGKERDSDGRGDAREISPFFLSKMKIKRLWCIERTGSFLKKNPRK
ncbi:hypothetical protein DEO72_LG9g2958 [Vigna unguiculata]|uniref:Uncharacterized protein n=1 Tax=Vigna unguiculata TaxID=3917 RepID=A0A4D6N735_VIGUN|nr:hypothetical protein DEO72_LG9g2958 [Vigna unguiculata]